MIQTANIPNLRHLRGLVAVAREGSISTGAKTVGLSQPAMTQAMASLERWAGIDLFERTPVGMRITDPGEMLCRRVERAFRYLEQGVVSAGGSNLAVRKVTLAQLDALAAAVEGGGFRSGARALGHNASSVSRACHELEMTLAVALFDTNASGLQANLHAEELVRTTRLAFAEIGLARDELNAWRGQVSGQLAVGCLPLAQGFILPYALARFTAEFPMIACKVADGYYDTLVWSLRRAEIDAIVGALRDGDLADDLEQTSLFSDRQLAVVARRDHPLGSVRNIALEQLASYGWVAPRSGAPARAYFDDLVRRLPSNEHRLAVIETGTHNVMRGLLRDTDRLSLVSQAQVREDIEQGSLCVLDIDLPDSARDIGYTVRKDWLPSQPQLRFLEILRTNTAEAMKRPFATKPD